jgi:hypothetical protein
VEKNKLSDMVATGVDKRAMCSLDQDYWSCTDIPARYVMEPTHTTRITSGKTFWTPNQRQHDCLEPQ